MGELAESLEEDSEEDDDDSSGRDETESSRDAEADSVTGAAVEGGGVSRSDCPAPGDDDNWLCLGADDSTWLPLPPNEGKCEDVLTL